LSGPAAPDAELIVVGAGIAGSALARLARAAGHSVLVVADPDWTPASAASLAVARRRWQEGTNRTRLDFSLEWYRRNGWLLAQQALVTDQRDRTRVQTDWYALDPTGPLVAPDVPGVAVLAARGRVTLRGGPTLSANRVVIAAGHGTAELHPSLEPDRLMFGHTWIGEGNLTGADLRAVHLGPYRSMIAVRHGGHTRLGSTRATTHAGSLEAAMRMLDDALERGMVKPGAWRTVDGVRAMGSTHGRPERVDYQTWSLTGLARCGYSLAPARAAELLTAMGFTCGLST
jgi:hypothetical protein